MKQQLSISRYPKTLNRSLRAWSAADELTLEHLTENQLLDKKITIYNDRFGFISCHLSGANSICSYKSQEKAISLNFSKNKLGSFTPLSIFDNYEKSQVNLISIPKSLEFFEFLLQKAAISSTADSVTICSFMTKHFTNGFIKLASKYFENVEQTKAKKKARLLILRKAKNITRTDLINSITYKGIAYKQYYGVFSAKNIDYATQFLIENLALKPSDNKILDLASGNGVIASIIKNKSPNSELHLLDDFDLAIESSKLNITDSNTFFHHNDSLERFDKHAFDLVVSNPPFHFEHENNIEVSICLFEQVQKVLKSNGRFILVANKHLNYLTHLKNIFTTCIIVAESDKFIIYEVIKLSLIHI